MIGNDQEIKCCPYCGSPDIEILYVVNVTTIIRCQECGKKQSIKEKDDGKER